MKGNGKGKGERSGEREERSERDNEEREGIAPSFLTCHAAACCWLLMKLLMSSRCQQHPDSRK